MIVGRAVDAGADLAAGNRQAGNPADDQDQPGRRRRASDTSDGAQEGSGERAARVLATENAGLRDCGRGRCCLSVCGRESRESRADQRHSETQRCAEVDHPQDSAERWDLSEINWLPAQPSRYRELDRGCPSGSRPIARYPPRAGGPPVWGGRGLCGATLPLHGPQVTLTWTPVPTQRLRQVT